MTEVPARSERDRCLPCFGRHTVHRYKVGLVLTDRARINSVCSSGKGSVPRGRVYANYASKCANERITVLNPASFGKLVRVLFPGLKTRRLGVRGESKYHYVNFTLKEESPEVHEAPAQIARPQIESTSFTPDFKYAVTPSNAIRVC